ncbi:MAG: RIP metalloprotease RseP [Muribaculaceae bacterium]|nr:RIP metalloprotease RseP [Muribaculaceae bacterium]
MDTFLIKAVQLILALSILVIIHEFGHFVFARLFGVRVSKFYIFSFPVGKERVIMKWRPKKYFKWFSTALNTAEKPEEKKEESPKAIPQAAIEATTSEAKPTAIEVNSPEENLDTDESKEKESFWNGTEYGIGFIPMFGYCDIDGMVDESKGSELLEKPAKKWEFRTKPAWQRFLIMFAGVLFNFLLAILIYAGIVYATGEKYVPFEKARMGMAYSGEAQKIGFKDGDIPLYADGEKLDNPNEARMKMIQASSVTVLRDGKDTVEIAIPEKFIFALDQEAKSDTATIAFLTYRFPARITQVMPGEGAAKAGIQTGDEIIAVDSVLTPTLLGFMKTLQGHENQEVKLSVARKNGEASDTLLVPVKLSETSKMGVALEIDPSAFYEAKEIKYGFLQSVPKGINMGTERLTSYAKSMKLVFTKEGAKSMGGFGALGSIFPERWDWIAFWNIVAFISIALAFMNIIPIPGLDGGHILFLLFESVTGIKVPVKFMEVANTIGLGLLILLMIYVNGMDIVRFFFK